MLPAIHKQLLQPPETPQPKDILPSSSCKTQSKILEKTAARHAGLIVTEELTPLQDNPGSQQEPGPIRLSNEQGNQGLPGSAAGEDATAFPQAILPEKATQVATTVTTEDMSLEQQGTEGGKSEGWSASLEQPKITAAVESQVGILVPRKGLKAEPCSYKV